MTQDFKKPSVLEETNVSYSNGSELPSAAPPAPLPYISRRALRRVKDWLPPPTCCPYCNGQVRLVDNREIYHGRSYGDWPYAYWCQPCDASVGLHPETDLPLGTLADRELREARKDAKRLWQRVASIEGLDRKAAYAWLAERMGIPARECHFGHFDLGRAALAFNVCDMHLFPRGVTVAGEGGE